jgi:hypothetical protein
MPGCRRQETKSVTLQRVILGELAAALLIAGCAGAGTTAAVAYSPSAAATSTLAATSSTPPPATTTSAPPADFTVVVLPDTQLYSALYPETFIAQTRWIADQQADRNIVFVSHVGDVVDSTSQSRQWDSADAAMSLLDGHVPYGIAPGNHDLREGGKAAFNANFGVARFEEQPWYGGHSGSDNLNSWQTFEASGMRFLVLHLARNPSAKTLRWARGVVEGHPGSRVILSTHNFLGKRGVRTSVGDEIWTGLVMESCSIFLVVSGHAHGAAHRSDDNTCGTPVEQVLQDYQDVGRGGNGFLTVFTFRPSLGRVEAEAFSPIVSGLPPDGEPFTFPFDIAVATEAARVTRTAP